MRIRRVLGYARVSSKLQAEGSSLDDQEGVIKAYAKSKGLPAPIMYVEAESSVREKIELRERMRALQADVRVGDLVACDKIDRWSRDPEFTYRSLREILQAGASFYAVGEGIDPSTDEGDSMLNFRILFAREESKRIRARTVGTRRTLRDRGYWSEGPPSFGYRRPFPKSHKGLEKNVLAFEEDEAKVVRRAYALAADRSLTQISDALGISRDLVGRILRNRAYLGEIQNTAGEWIKGKHSPIIDVATFTRAQGALDGRRLDGPGPRDAPSETSTWILRDVARCDGCGAKMSAAYAGPRAERRYYFKCAHKCGAAYVSVPNVEAKANLLVIARLDELKEDLAREPKRSAPAKVSDFASRRAKVQRRREKYQDAFAEDLMSKEELRIKMAKLDAEALHIEGEEQAAMRPSPLADAGARRAMLREVGVRAKAWGHATAEERRAIVRHLAVAAKMSTGKQPKFTWRSAEELAKVI